jgi:hypothetical protein
MSAGRGATDSVIVDDNIYVSNGYQEKGGNANYIEKYNITDNNGVLSMLLYLPKNLLIQRLTIIKCIFLTVGEIVILKL